GLAASVPEAREARDTEGNPVTGPPGTSPVTARNRSFPTDRNGSVPRFLQKYGSAWVSLVPRSVDLTDDSPAGASGSAAAGEDDDGTFSVVSWNVDGLDLNDLSERARAVCSYLTLYSPTVVFLQEVIPPYYDYLKKRATGYTIVPGCEDGYFTVIMLKKSRVKLISQEITPFPETQMMRNLLSVQVTGILGNELCLMTSHLESTRESSEERVNQLRTVVKKMQETPEAATVIFGGDTNLRDSEVSKLGGLPADILDIWEFLGEPESCRYTWDTQANCNLRVRYKRKLRFDRLFFRAAAQGGRVVPRSLDLLGTEKLDCGRFPSDHWGLLCHFDVVS
uniref:Tyrosyl-DNA phosphodiesterase 2 n=1 Tax=Ornithorhynchus anatinus TaxID=9258 RepID=A0A6I8MXF7_ORNAN